MAELCRCPICLSNHTDFIITNHVNPFTNKSTKLEIAYRCEKCNMSITKSRKLSEEASQQEVDQTIVLLRDEVLFNWNRPRIIEKVTKDMIEIPM
jgi:hypothetical protein